MCSSDLTAPALSERVMDGLHLTEPPSYRDIMETKPPPKLVWVLVGVPIDRFGEVRPQVTALQAVAGVSVQVNGDGQ